MTEVSVEPPKSPEKKPERIKMEKDTTSQHKSHLFDLHCKICTGTAYILEQTALISGGIGLPMLSPSVLYQGRMAPPVEEASTKVVKVATTVVKRQPTKVEEAKSTATPSVEDELHLGVLEESFRSTQSGSEGRWVLVSFQVLVVTVAALPHRSILCRRFEHIVGRDEEAAFLSGLKTLWRGFIHMHAVAKLVTKAFPVSGVMDNLNEVTTWTKTAPHTCACQQGLTFFLFSNRTFQTAFMLAEGSVRRLCGITWRRFEQLAQKYVPTSLKVLKCKHPQFHMFHSN